MAFRTFNSVEITKKCRHSEVTQISQLTLKKSTVIKRK